ncbi:hypothetical protein [Sphingomonas pituitosa]|uniref:hypothetical protein n=1 Tax=Sphingomonas pituitosa TaxID=99597 RepID=UPI00082E9F6C|nr:hypothetical protein [Sphingomonas pituitosa]
MRAFLLAIGLVALAACSSKVDEAEADLAMIKNAHPTRMELCAAHKRVAEAYLQTRDQEKYNEKKLAAEIMCSGDMNAPDPASPQADNLEVKNVEIGADGASK